MDSAELLSRYSRGERDFSMLNLSRFRLGDSDLKGANFTGADLSYADLSGSDLSDATLSGANLSKACLCATNLDNANCQGVDFRNASLTGDCHGINTNYSYADFRGNALAEGILENSNFTGANFAGSHISQYSFLECNLTAANFNQSRLSEVSFDNCNLAVSDFSVACLDLDFRCSILDNASFRKATLDICNKERLDEIQQWSNVDFTRTVFYFGRYSQLVLPENIDTSNVIVIRYHSDLSDVNLSGCNLEYIDLSGMNLTNANLSEAKLADEPEYIKAIFCNTILPNGNIWSNVG